MRAAGVAAAIAGVAALATLALTACGGNRTDDASPVAGDTLRGVVVITGADPITYVDLRSDDGRLRLTGEAADSLRAMDGLEVWVAGDHMDDGSFDVRAFRVRGMDRTPAADGVLEIDGGDAVLVTASGERLRFANAPRALRDLEGRRVWIAGRPGQEPQAWGAIGSRR